MTRMMKYTFATLLSSSDYLLGVIVLYKSLQKYGKTQYPFLCVCSKSIKDNDISKLEKVGIKCKKLSTSATEDTDLSSQPPEYRRWSNTFDKLLIWGLTEYDKIVFVDSDMIVLDNLDDLFDKAPFTAVAAGSIYNWNHFNSGLMVVEPDMGIHNDLISLIPSTIDDILTEKGCVGDEDVVIKYMPDWVEKENLHLHEGYNMIFRGMTEYHRKMGFNYGKNIKVVHFIGPWYDKPWNHSLWKVFYHLVGYFLHNRYGLKAYIAYQRMLWRYRISNNIRNVFK